MYLFFKQWTGCKVLHFYPFKKKKKNLEQRRRGRFIKQILNIINVICFFVCVQVCVVVLLLFFNIFYSGGGLQSAEILEGFWTNFREDQAFWICFQYPRKLRYHKFKFLCFKQYWRRTQALNNLHRRSKKWCVQLQINC